MLESYLYVVKLIRAVLWEEKPEEKPAELSWEKIFQISCEHMVVSLTFEGLSKLEEKPQEPLFSKWMELSQKALVKELTFDAERAQILSALEEAGIAYLPLKGVVIKNYYPKPGLRQFSDNDILYDKRRRNDVKQIMHALGFAGKQTGVNHDEYYKQPVFNFEMHTDLLPEYKENYSYFQDIWQRAVRQGTGYEYRMTDNDFYLYHIAHMEKHFCNNGTGLRYFVDQYYLEKYQVWEDREKLEEELEKMSLLSFERKISRLTRALFGMEKIDLHDKELLELFAYIMGSGAYGKYENGVQNWLDQNHSKAAYVIHRIFPEDYVLRSRFPILKKAPWLKPVMVIWRILLIPVTKKDKIRADFKILFQKNKS